jgi:hypothetical protein
MKPENLLEPSFWEALGVTPIVIDTSTSESLETGLAEVFTAIETAVDDINSENGGTTEKGR